MPSIHIRHRHATRPELARQEVDRIAEQMARKHAVECRWQGNALAFRRPGLEGTILVDEAAVTVSAKLGLALLPLKAALVREVRDLLSRHFPNDNTQQT